MIAVMVTWLLVAEDADLTLSVNRTSICQRDPLVVKAVLANHGEDLIKMTGKPARSNRIRYQQQINGKWIPLPSWSTRSGIGTMMPGSRGGDGQFIAKDASCAEYDVIVLDSKDNFIFDKLGKSQIRAIAETSVGQLTSAPVTIVVEPRKPEQLERIESAKKWLYLIGQDVPSHGSVPKQLVELRDVGGNIAKGIDQLLLVERIRGGAESVGDENVAKFVRRHASGVDCEVTLILLGYHYNQRQDYKRLAQVVEAIPDMTVMTREWEYYLDLRTPSRFVPGKQRDK